MVKNILRLNPQLLHYNIMLNVDKYATFKSEEDREALSLVISNLISTSLEKEECLQDTKE